KTQGGTKPITINIVQSTNGLLDNVSLKYDDWLNSVNRESESLIGVGSPDTEIFLISEFIDNPITKKEVEYALIEKENNPRMIWLTKNTSDINNRTYMLGVNNLTEMKIGLAPYVDPFRSNFILEPIRQNSYYKIKLNNLYLDSEVYFSTISNNSSQMWKIYFIGEGDKFMIQNIKTGQYLSSYDAKLYDFSSITEERLIWGISIFP
ncbi:MAG: hypothetical protein LIP08_02220, partial [Bacteroides sp.]|nr:hypothetical protein [Bacteroides sp.]